MLLNAIRKVGLLGDERLKLIRLYWGGISDVSDGNANDMNGWAIHFKTGVSFLEKKPTLLTLLPQSLGFSPLHSVHIVGPGIKMVP